MLNGQTHTEITPTTKPVPTKKKRRKYMKQPVLLSKATAYLAKHPNAQAKEVAKAIGTTPGNFYNVSAEARKQAAKLREEQEKAAKLREESVQLELPLKELKLTQRQLDMAKVLDIPPVQYARELAKIADELSQGRSTTRAPRTPTRPPATDPTPAADTIPTSMTYQVGGDHYKDNPIQPWAAMEAWMGGEQFVGFLRGNVIKYIARCDKKGGVEDLKKAQHYLTKLIEICEGDASAR